MGRFFHNINTLVSLRCIVASLLHLVLSSYYPFQQINSIKKGKVIKRLVCFGEPGRFFFYRPVSSGIVQGGFRG